MHSRLFVRSLLQPRGCLGNICAKYTISKSRHVASSSPSLPANSLSDSDQWPSLLSLARSILAHHPLRPRLTPFVRAFEVLTRRPLPRLGRQVHAQMTLRGLLPGGLLGAKIVAMYATSGDLSSAVNIFRSVEPPALILYNALIRAYAWFGLAEKALGAYVQMRSLGFWGDHFTYPFVLKSCAELKRIRMGKYVHALAAKVGLDTDAYVGTSLIDMYVKCGEIADARKMFDEMPERDVSTWNALIAGYMKAGEVSLAEELFAAMPRRNVVTWTAMISGSVQNGLAGEAIALFDKMVSEEKDDRPNWVTMMSVLQACSHLAALDRGRRVHEMARRAGLASDPSVKSALVTMYARCGSLSESRKSFEGIPPERRDTSAWNAMITAYASHGRGTDSVSTFESMLRSGAKPDEITFAALLSGCSHSGLVEAGINFFNQMGSEYGVPPGSQHFACLVDLLGRAGRLKEAKDVINRAGPSRTGPSAWGALLAACQKQNDLETARTAAEKLFVLEPKNAANYVHLANMYADAGLCDEAGRVRGLALSRGLRKSPGQSWTEVKGRAHLFMCGDRAHPQAEKIYSFLEELAGRLREAGYWPATGAARHDVSEEEKEASLGAHSERLAVAFAVLNTGPAEVVRVTKNIRVCVDCHTAIKAMSKVLAREILVRDLTRFHRFVDGECSCGDYW